MRLIKALPLVIFAAVAFSAQPLAQAPAPVSAVAGQILVKFRPGVISVAKADVHRANGGRVLSEISRTGVQLVSVAAGDETGAINRYRRNPNVLYAERNIIRRIPKPVPIAKPTHHTPGTEVVPGDYYFREQWALHNTGQLFYCIPWINGQPLCFYIGTNDADIDAPEAWAVSTGNTVLVAVIDTGIDYTHPDLMINYAGGMDFVNGDSDPMDDHGHGTHVSGTIAASLNNVTGDPSAEEGVVGVAPNARIVAYKVCDGLGNCSDFAIEQAIAQSIASGARVINMSLGGPDISQSLTDAVQDAWEAGIVIVAGAGNDGNTNRFYPAALPNVVSVGAFDEDHRRATFSNYGDWVDISAPGNVILSAYPMAECVDSGIPGDAGCYNYLSGTSMATPHVSGAAALVWSRGDVSSNSQVVDILLNSADPQGVASARLDSWTIHGGLNIHNALSYGGGATNLAPIANAGPDQTVVDTGGNGVESVTLNGSNSSDPDGSIVTYEWRQGSTVVAVGATPAVSLPLGVHTLTLQVTDDDGATASDTVAITVRANQAPVANAGPDQTVVDIGGDGESVTLNGSNSSDPDGSIVTYQWREGSTVVAAGATPTVSLPVGVHTLTLQVTDNDGATASDTVAITVRTNLSPVANAGADQILTDTGGDGSEAVLLNGSGSSDSDGTVVSYVWRRGSTVIALGVTPAAVSLPVGVHTISLQVTDDLGATATDTVDIAINAAPPPPPPPPSSVHAGDIDAVTSGDKNMWSAVLTVTVHNTSHQPVAGATVTGTWGGALSGIASCVTISNGTCVISSGAVRKRESSASFTISSIAASGLSYVAVENHDPDGSSNGTVIVIVKP